MLWSQVTIVGLLSSTTFAAVQPKQLAKRGDCRAQVLKIGGQEFTIQCDADRAGNNIGSPLRISAPECGKACANDKSCVTAQYSNGYCYKKKSQNQLSVVKGTTTYDKGKGCTSNLKVGGCNVKCNTDSPGNNLDNGQYVGSYAACAALCAANSKCATAQYKTTNGYCYQKSKINGRGFSPCDYTISLVCPNNGYPGRSSSSTTSTTTTSSSTTTTTSTGSIHERSF
ncbi:hypothetical protein CB0940_10463 [Cercospora beticola]|uniref:Apple domain-containing protein n=1 Tax=Cercospora beticola TaxID=122368 RepID=A0A2G5HUJ2_CERBT|nr:hypothetical protein CB0940_10463 [Cercospora beticola]PIA96204.1 hypothetical protein CB0940_10463 [Cercospora beticola]WPB07181.1 hypothetical protein RHO25_011842 [Cercospora beticola]CAK1367140.1 unnamed protein product [Cercospora beticola]